MGQPKLFWIAIVGNVVGVIVFGIWLAQSDYIYGNYVGPMWQFYLAMALIVAGIGSAFGWIGRALMAIVRRAGESDSTKSGFFRGMLLLLLTLPAGLCVVIGVAMIVNQ